MASNDSWWRGNNRWWERLPTWVKVVIGVLLVAHCVVGAIAIHFWEESFAQSGIPENHWALTVESDKAVFVPRGGGPVEMRAHVEMNREQYEIYAHYNGLYTRMILVGVLMVICTAGILAAAMLTIQSKNYSERLENAVLGIDQLTPRETPKSPC